MTKLGEDVKVLSLDQAVEDCTRCLDICEYLHENKGPSVSDARLKSLMRRAEAKSMLGRLYAPQPPCVLWVIIQQASEHREHVTDAFSFALKILWRHSS